MSFYGKVTYYLSNAFSKVIYRNANSKSTKPGNIQVNDGTLGPGSPSYEYALSPRSRNDDVILETGNKWIVFADPQGTVSNNQIRIFHQVCDSPLNQGGTIQVNVDTPEENEQVAKDGNINFGDLITIPTIVFDEAGHISNVTTQILQMSTPPGAEDLDSLKYRIAILEQLVTGQHNDGGENEQNINTDNTSYGTEINSIKNKIDSWTLTPGPDSNDLNYMYKERNGIGTTLHQVMIKLGLRASREYVEDGNTYIGYTDTEENPAEGTLMDRVSKASTQAISSATIAISNRRGVRDLLDELRDLGVLGPEYVATLKNTRFSLAGIPDD